MWVNVCAFNTTGSFSPEDVTKIKKKILALRIKSDSARIFSDSDRMLYWTTHCAEER